MPRKAALIAEEYNESVPNSPLRRSTRSRVASSPAPQTAPIATVGRTRRSSTSSVGSDISVASVASLPAVVKGAVRGRRPSLSQESNLEKIGETGKSSDVTPVKKARRGTISTLQDDASALSVRVGSPAVVSVSNRSRSLRSASKSPTLSIKESASDYAVSNGTPSKVRDRRLSAEKTAPKRLASVALEPLVEGNEADSPKKAVSKEAAVDNDEKMEEIAEEIKTVESKETLDIIAKKEHTKNQLSSESSKETDDAKAGVSSEQINTKIDIKQIDDITKGLLTQTVREQFLRQAQVVISPLTNKIAADKLFEMSELIPNDIKVNEAPEKTDSSALLNTEIIPLKNTLDDTKPTPKRTNLTTPQSPVRRSPRLFSETVSDSSNTPVNKAEIPSDLSSIGRASLNSSKQSRKSISKEPKPTKDIEIKPPNKIVEVNSDESLNLSLKSTILSSQEDGLNKSKQSRKSISKEPTPTIEIEIKPPNKIVEVDSDESLNLSVKSTNLSEDGLNKSKQSRKSISKEPTPTIEIEIESPSKSFNKSVEVVDGSDGSFNLSLKSTILSSQEDGGLNKSKQSPKSISKEPTPTKDIKIESPNKSVEADSDGSFNLSLKSTILSSQEDGLNMSNVIDKDGDKSANIDHKSEFSNESDKENTDKRVSNVFKSKNVEESFFEAMDVEYPSDNDESFSGANKKRASMKSLANTQLSNITSDDSTSGSLHLICSDDSHGEEKKGKELIQLDALPGNIPPLKSAALLVDEPQKISSILDSRISILPGKVLTPVYAAKEKDDLDKSLQLNASSSSKDNKSIICEDPHKSIDLDGFEMTDDESVEILAINTEMEDGTGNRELVQSKKTNESLAKQKDCCLKIRQESDEENQLIDSSEESERENNPGTKLNDLVLTVSIDSSDSDYQPNLSKEIIEITDEYDSNPAQTSDDSDIEENTHEIAKKNKEIQHFRFKSSDSSETSDPESKHQLIESKTVVLNEDSDQSDSEDMFLDDKVSDEDTPSEDSNDIITISETSEKSINQRKRKKTSTNSIDDEVFLPDLSSNGKSEGMPATPRPSNIGILPDHVIMELVRAEESTLKTDVSPEKKSKKRRKRTMTAEEFNMFCKPSTSHAGTAGQWNVTELTPGVKPSKCNATNLIAEGVIDMKDFKNIMIARNKLKPQRSKRSFMSSLKTRKEY